jgi:hypothetical protein
MQAIVWLALVALAIAGRLWQPSWNGEPLWHATPLAAVALAAGYLFANPLVAASVLGVQPPPSCVIRVILSLIASLIDHRPRASSESCSL